MYSTRNLLSTSIMKTAGIKMNTNGLYQLRFVCFQIALASCLLGKLCTLAEIPIHEMRPAMKIIGRDMLKTDESPVSKWKKYPRVIPASTPIVVFRIAGATEIMNDAM